MGVVTQDAIVANHIRLTNRAQISHDWQHYMDLVQHKPGALRNGTRFMDLPPVMLRLRQSLLRHAGGDRVVAQVLTVVPPTGLEAVLVAGEVLLEDATPIDPAR